MNDYKAFWVDRVTSALQAEADELGIDIGPIELGIETPPNDLGDLAFPMFAFARQFRRSPVAIATAITARMERDDAGEASAAGPYVNIRYSRTGMTVRVLEACLTEGERYGTNTMLDGQRITIEFSSPNTNKPLHLGHLRNDALGESVSRVLAACGAEVRSVNLLNDRGIHICKSMLAYRKFGNGETPESRGVKGDRLVGDYYVKYSEWEKSDPEAEPQAREMLRAWEAGDEKVVALWKTMNSWVLAGHAKTYAATGISFDAIYFESDTYSSGRTEILRGLEEGRFHRE